MQIASTLLNYGAETNTVTKQGVTPLHLASQEGHTDMVTLLLDKGANIHMSTKVFSFRLWLQSGSLLKFQ
jgi:ankyrin